MLMLLRHYWTLQLINKLRQRFALVTDGQVIYHTVPGALHLDSTDNLVAFLTCPWYAYLTMSVIVINPFFHVIHSFGLFHMREGQQVTYTSYNHTQKKTTLVKYEII